MLFHEQHNFADAFIAEAPEIRYILNKLFPHGKLLIYIVAHGIVQFIEDSRDLFPDDFNGVHV
jgi:hypothetical protein